MSEKARAPISMRRFANLRWVLKENARAGQSALLTSCASSARRSRSPMNKPRTAIIGSGFGGLAAAIRLQAAGLETVIFEKRDLAGGRAYVYRDRGFTFDAGPTVITDPTAIEELFALSGRRLEDYVTLVDVSPF